MEIEKLIVKYLVGCLSKEEDQILKKWLQEDESHLRFFQKINLDKTAVENNRQYHRFDAKSDEAFRKVWTSLHKGTRRISTQRKIGFFSRRWLKIACALLILLFSVGGGLYFYYEASRITPGESKAILTLEDGSAKQLKKSGQEHWIYIGDTPIAREYDGMIVYHIPETSKVEISQQNTLSVPRGGEFRLTLSDGTRVHLNSLSELKYPVSFKGMNERTVELKGEAFFEIAKDSLHPFKVETQGILIQQFGTAFNVKSRVKGKVEVALVQGSIGIYTQSQKLHKLSPGQLAIWDASTDLLSVENKDLLLNTAWHSNRFIFYDESLGSLMEELALWYNVDVDFLDKSLKELHFTGSLYRYDDIAVILNAIEETVNVDFKISGLRIKIDRKNK